MAIGERAYYREKKMNIISSYTYVWSSSELIIIAALFVGVSMMEPA